MATAEELAAQKAASDAWYAANVSKTPVQQSSTAEQAAATSTGYQNNTLTVLPKYGVAAGAQQNTNYTSMSQTDRKIAYAQEGNPLIYASDNPSNPQSGNMRYYTPAEFQELYGVTDVQYEQAKYAVFNAPGSVSRQDLPMDLRQTYDEQMVQTTHEYFMANPSPEFLAITGQYAEQQNRVIGGYGIMYQGSPAKSLINPFKGTVLENSAASIAWEVAGGWSGAGGSDYLLNEKARAEIAWYNKKYGTNIDPGFITYATNVYVDRPSFPQEILTAKTGQHFVNKAWEGTPIRVNITGADIAKMKNIPSGFFEPGVHVAPGDWGGMYSNVQMGKGTPSTLPDRLQLNTTLAGGIDGGNVTMFMPIGDEGNKMAVPNSKLAMSKETGEFGVYQYNKLHNAYMLVGGGGRNALQSGMFTIVKPGTPWVTTQESAGTKFDMRYADVPEAQKLMAAPELYARPGAEAYGGVVRVMDTQHPLSPKEAVSVYQGSEGKYNLANFVMPVAMGKAEAPGAKIPWQVGSDSPVIQFMNEKGVIAGISGKVPGERLVYSKTVGSKGVSSDIVISDLPKPFISKSEPPTENQEYQPSGFLGLGGLLPQISNESMKAWGTNYKSRPVEGAVSLFAAGLQSEVSMVQGITSRLTFGMSEFIPILKPAPITIGTGSSASVRSTTTNLPTTISTERIILPNSTAFSGGNQTINNLWGWLSGNRESIDLKNKTAVSEYNANVELFSKMQDQNPFTITTSGGIKTITTETGGTKTITTVSGASSQKTYASEWDRFVEGSGRVFRYATDITLEKQKNYFDAIKSDPSTIGEVKRGVFYIGTEIVNKPAELAPAAILGWLTMGGAGIAPSFLASAGTGTGATAAAARFLSTPGGASLAKAGIVGAFEFAYTYSVTDKFTSTPDKTKENIYRSIPTLAAAYGGAGGFNWVGETKFVRGASAPSGSTFTGVRIYDTYFGAGKTPIGQKYVGAFSHVESYVFTKGGTATPAAMARPQVRALPEPIDITPESAAKASSMTESAEVFQHIDISGRSLPFEVKTQAESIGGYRDTSGASKPFSMKTQTEYFPTRRTPSHPQVSEIFEGDTSGKAPQFSLKTQAEVESGFWDTPEIFGGDISGRAPRFSMKTELEFTSEIPRDVSGKADTFSVRSQKEIMSEWELERSGKEQTFYNVGWASNTVLNRVPPGFMDTLIDTEKALQIPSPGKTAWKPWNLPNIALNPKEEPSGDVYNPLNPKREYAPAPELHYKLKDLINAGVPERVLQAELAILNPTTRSNILGINQEYTPIENRYPYTRIERDAANLGKLPSERGMGSISIWRTPDTNGSVISNTTKKQTISVANPLDTAISSMKMPYVSYTPSGKIIQSFAPFESNKEIVNPASKTTITTTPFRTTTPTTKIITDITPFEETQPWKRTTDTPPPTDTIYPYKLDVPPLKPVGGGGGFLPGGGSNGPSGYIGFKSWTNVHPVGADLIGPSRGSLPNIPGGMRRKGKGMKMPKFKAPKF